MPEVEDQSQVSRPAEVATEDLKDAGAALGAAVAAAVPASVAVGIGLMWLRLHDAGLDPLPVLARVPKDDLALEGSQVLLYVLASVFVAVGIVLAARVGRVERRKSVRGILRLVGGFLLVLALAMEERWTVGPLDFSKGEGGFSVIEEPARWAAVAGGGFLLAAALIFRKIRWNNWQFSVLVGLIYASLATGAVFAYLAIANRGTTRESLGPTAVVLLDRPRPVAKGLAPRRRQEGQLVYATADGVALCLRCDPDYPFRRVLEFPRKRIVWVQINSRNTATRRIFLPARRDPKPEGQAAGGPRQP